MQYKTTADGNGPSRAEASESRDRSVHDIDQRVVAAVAMLKVEAVILGLASIWSLRHGVLPGSLQDATWLLVLDFCWPLSMIGMMVIGITGRWRGLLRWWPLVAESWAFVTIPAMVVFGDAASRWVGGGHLLIGYATLGVLLALKPELVTPKD